jgi:PHD/YefM family antitoxin component YafN of YafNO toxin-antitoxin module
MRTIQDMGLPKITKQTDLRENLYKTLEEIATGGSPHLIPTKNGDVVILSRKEYDEILFEKELLQEFQEPIKLSELTEAEKIITKLDKKFGFKK